MTDFNKIIDHCEKSSSLSKKTIDDFLIYYSAAQDRIDREFDQRFSRYKKTTAGMPQNWIGLIKAQYIAHRIFKQDGFIQKYLKHASVKDMIPEHQNYLKQQASQPWRFSFSDILSIPGKDFYEMEDVFTGETYLLYSKSVSRTWAEHPVLRWFNLIGFNGVCWQTFGPVGYFQSFDEDDIFFYATEFSDSIESNEELTDDMENNPIPYMMLMRGSNYPLIRNNGHECVQVTGRSAISSFNYEELRKTFTVEYARQVYRISHKEWSGPPHFAEAFYDEERNIVLLTALTESGYLEMAILLTNNGIDFPGEPEIRLHPSMISMMEELLQKKSALNPYSKFFEKKSDSTEDAALSRLNEFLRLAIPFINAGQEPDIEMLAKKAGVNVEDAQMILRQSKESINKLKKH